MLLPLQQLRLILITVQSQKTVRRTSAEELTLLQLFQHSYGVYFQYLIPGIVTKYIVHIFKIFKIQVRHRIFPFRMLLDKLLGIPAESAP